MLFNRLVKTARALRARFLRAITLAVNHFVAQITRLRASHLLNQTLSTQTLSTENSSETFALRSEVWSKVSELYYVSLRLRRTEVERAFVEIFDWFSRLVALTRDELDVSPLFVNVKPESCPEGDFCSGLWRSDRSMKPNMTSAACDFCSLLRKLCLTRCLFS